MKKVLSFVLAAALSATLAVPAFAASSITFSDVPQGHWAYEAVMDMTDRGMFSGTTAPVNGVGTFAPDAAMSRAAFITVLVRYLYPEEIQPTAAGQQWWENPVAVAKAHGLVQDGEFADMNGTMLRQEMAVVLVRAAEQMGETPDRLVATDKIADYDTIASEYQSYVRKCFSMGLIGGVDSKGTFLPLGQMNRAQAATVIYRLINKETRGEVDFSGASNGWENTGGNSDGSHTGNIGYIAGQMVSDSKLSEWGITRPASRVNGGDWNTFNGFLFDAYDYRFVGGGIGLNLEDDGKFAKILGSTDKGWGIEVFQWRKSYASDVATNASLNMVLEAFYYACGDREVAYALWSVVDYMSINGSAATTVSVIEGFGLKTANETNNSIDLSMNGVNIRWEWGNGGNIFYFN